MHCEKCKGRISAPGGPGRRRRSGRCSGSWRRSQARRRSPAQRTAPCRKTAVLAGEAARAPTQKAPYRTDSLRKTRRPLNRPAMPRTVGPAQPARQRQLRFARAPPATQVPPFRHGSGWHCADCAAQWTTDSSDQPVAVVHVQRRHVIMTRGSPSYTEIA
jgi:hypothetical protein